RAREDDLLRGIPPAPSLRRPADAMARRADQAGHDPVSQLHPQLRRGDPPPDRDHEGPVLPAHHQKHDLHAGDAGAAAADQRPPLEVQERSAALAARDHGAVPREQGQPAGRVPADGRPDPDLLRALRRAVRLGGDAERVVHLLRTAPVLGSRAGRPGSVDLRSRRPRSYLRVADPHGRVDVRPAEAPAGDGRSAAGQDDAVHAGPLHVHVLESALGARAVLDPLERAPDRPAEVHGAGREGAAQDGGAVPQEGVSREPTPGSTIVAISTPPGTGAIGVIRVSGPGAVSCAGELLSLDGGKPLSVLPPRALRRARIVDPESDSPLDEALVVVMPAPRSYTGEDVVEISTHGNPVLLARVVHLLVGRGTSLAEPGEFTRRAFLNGRIDLLQAEAVAAIIGGRAGGGRGLAAGAPARVLGGEVGRWLGE